MVPVYRSRRQVERSWSGHPQKQTWRMFYHSMRPLLAADERGENSALLPQGTWRSLQRWWGWREIREENPNLSYQRGGKLNNIYVVRTNIKYDLDLMGKLLEYVYVYMYTTHARCDISWQSFWATTLSLMMSSTYSFHPQNDIEDVRFRNPTSLFFSVVQRYFERPYSE